MLIGVESFFKNIITGKFVNTAAVSKEVFPHSRWKLDWQSTKFELLGVNFSLNLDELLDLNYTTILIDIKNTLCQ